VWPAARRARADRAARSHPIAFAKKVHARRAAPNASASRTVRSPSGPVVDVSPYFRRPRGGTSAAGPSPVAPRGHQRVEEARRGLAKEGTTLRPGKTRRDRRRRHATFTPAHDARPWICGATAAPDSMRSAPRTQRFALARVGAFSLSKLGSSWLAEGAPPASPQWKQPRHRLYRLLFSRGCVPVGHPPLSLSVAAGSGRLMWLVSLPVWPRGACARARGCVV